MTAWWLRITQLAAIVLKYSTVTWYATGISSINAACSGMNMMLPSFAP